MIIGAVYVESRKCVQCSLLKLVRLTVLEARLYVAPERRFAKPRPIKTDLEFLAQQL